MNARQLREGSPFRVHKQVHSEVPALSIVRDMAVPRCSASGRRSSPPPSGQSSRETKGAYSCSSFLRSGCSCKPCAAFSAREKSLPFLAVLLPPGTGRESPGAAWDVRLQNNHKESSLRNMARPFRVCTAVHANQVITWSSGMMKPPPAELRPAHTLHERNGSAAVEGGKRR